jgi:hypothetical protein
MVAVTRIEVRQHSMTYEEGMNEHPRNSRSEEHSKDDKSQHHAP